MSLVLWVLVFVASLAGLVIGADVFTDNAEKVGVSLGIPPFIVGVTIVTLGTTLPEMVSSVLAVLRGAPEIVLGNVVGSNVTNIFLVLGVAAIIGKRLRVTYEIVKVDLPLVVGSAFVLGLAAFDGVVTRPEALILLLGAVIYIAYIVSTARRIRRGDHEYPLVDLPESVPAGGATWLKLAASAALVYVGADWTVRSVIELSGLLSIAPSLIAVTAVALGTSLPELTVGLASARKGNLELAVGNVLGASILNSFAVTGIAGLLGSLPADEQILRLGLPIMVVATLLYFFITEDKEVSLWEGWLLVLLYVMFLGKMFGLV